MKPVVVSLFLLCTGLSLASQDKLDTERVFCGSSSYLLSYYYDGLRIPASPFRWDSRQWLLAGAVAGTATAVYFLDGDIQKSFQRNQSAGFNFVSRYIAEDFGDVPYGIGSMSLLVLYGSLSGKENVCRLGLTGTKAFVLTTLTAQTAKFLFHRQRPYEGSAPDPYVWHGPGVKRENLSFFSNHTANAFALATVIAAYADNKLWLKSGIYALASLTALSRIYDNQHWASDVIIGAAVGYGIGKLCMNSEKWSPRISPYHNIATRETGLSVMVKLP